MKDVTEACSDLLLKLFAELSPKLVHTNTTLLRGNIIASVLTNRPTRLQITLGTILRQKSLNNFDANIASANGLKSTHSLALLITQLQEYIDDSQVSESSTMRRLRKEELKEAQTLSVNIQHYNEPQIPAMPEACAMHRILPLRILAAKIFRRSSL